MKALFELTHPKHFYQFRFVINKFVHRGFDVKIIARDKDVLLQLLRDEGYEYEIYGKHKKKMKGKIFNILNIFMNYLKIIHIESQDTLHLPCFPCYAQSWTQIS